MAAVGQNAKLRRCLCGTGYRVLRQPDDGLQIIDVQIALARTQMNLLGDAFLPRRTGSTAARYETQIHTHMRYSEFSDIVASIADMDADVITIETSRSDMELLDAFDSFNYPDEIGPGVYDIHSPNPDAAAYGSAHAPDGRAHSRLAPLGRPRLRTTCRWAEVIPALQNLVQAAKLLCALEAG